MNRSQYHEDYMKPFTKKQSGMFDMLKNECRNFNIATNIYSRSELKNAGVLRDVERAEIAVRRLHTLLETLKQK